MANRESDELMAVEQMTGFDMADDYADQQIYKCTNCNSKNTGFVEKEASFLTIAASVLSLLVFRFYAVLILPLIIESTKTSIKKCLKCEHVLEKQELMSVPSLNDQILKFSCGGCAVVLSRKYAFVIIIFMIIGYFMLPKHEEVVNPGGRWLSELKWEDFVDDCGRKVILNNGVRAKNNFEKKYNGNIIEWNGVINNKIDKSLIDDPSIEAVLLIKMNPSDSKEEYPDIQLIFSPLTFRTYHEIFNQAEVGNVIKYKAVMRKMGDEFHYHHFDLQEISLTGEKIDPKSIPMIQYTGNVGNRLRREKDSNPAQIDGQAAANPPQPAN